MRHRKLSQANQRAHQNQSRLHAKDRADVASEPDEAARQAFAQLPPIAQAMLRYWISCAIAPAASLEPRDAARLKKDFSSEVCLISVPQFVGAMLDAGYEPSLTGDGRWLFPIRRGNDATFEGEPGWRYTLGHPSQRFHQLDLQLQEYTDLFGPLTTEDVAEEDEEDVGDS